MPPGSPTPSPTRTASPPTTTTNVKGATERQKGASAPAPTPAAAAAPAQAAASPTPAATAEATPAATLTATPTPKEDAAIEALGLTATAKAAAYKLKQDHPTIVFTSGLRTKADQARAMAGNVVSDRSYIKNTYKATNQGATACQKWVDDNPTKKTKAEIESGLLGVIDGLNQSQLDGLSKHLSGNAFDVNEDDSDEGKKIKAAMDNTPGGKFVPETVGKPPDEKHIWHLQF
jgi:hypothetical protein